jgi:hypothetical protein
VNAMPDPPGGQVARPGGARGVPPADAVGVSRLLD